MLLRDRSLGQIPSQARTFPLRMTGVSWGWLSLHGRKARWLTLIKKCKGQQQKQHPGRRAVEMLGLTLWYGKQCQTNLNEKVLCVGLCQPCWQSITWAKAHWLPRHHACLHSRGICAAESATCWYETWFCRAIMWYVCLVQRDEAILPT